MELLASLQQYREGMMPFIRNDDAVVSPVTNTPAWPHAEPTKPQDDAE